MQPDPQMFQRDLYPLQIWLNPCLTCSTTSSRTFLCTRSYRISCKNHSSHPANNPQEKERSSWDCEEKKISSFSSPWKWKVFWSTVIVKVLSSSSSIPITAPCETKSKIPIRQTMTSAIFATATALECSMHRRHWKQARHRKGNLRLQLCLQRRGVAEHCSSLQGYFLLLLKGQGYSEDNGINIVSKSRIYLKPSHWPFLSFGLLSKMGVTSVVLRLKEHQCFSSGCFCVIFISKETPGDNCFKTLSQCCFQVCAATALHIMWSSMSAFSHWIAMRSEDYFILRHGIQVHTQYMFFFF